MIPFKGHLFTLSCTKKGKQHFSCAFLFLCQVGHFSLEDTSGFWVMQVMYTGDFLCNQLKTII